MASPLEEEEIDEIIETVAELEDIDEAVEQTGRSQATVRKYVKRAIKDGDERLIGTGVYPDLEKTTDWAGSGPNSTPFAENEEEDDTPKYQGMGPGDFLHAFFEDFEIGVKRSWVEIQARRADRRGLLPPPDKLRHDILTMASGISQSSNQEADYIAEEYWAEAQEFFRQAGQEFNPQNAQQQMQGQQGGWNQMGGYQQGHQQQQAPPGWVQQQQPQQSSTDQLVQTLIQQNREMMQEFRSILHEQNQRDNDPGTVAAEIEKFQQLKGLVDDLSGQGADELSQVLDKHMAELRQAVANQGNAQAAAPGESLEDKLITLAATSDKVSFDDVMKVLEKRGSMDSDPEVIKAKYDKEMREAELEHETERYERLGQVFEQGLSQIGEGFARGIVRGNPNGTGATDTEADGGQAREAETAATATGQPQPDPDPEPCPHCSSDMIPTEVGTFCPECEYGVVQCDLCQAPVEMPPIGESEYGQCPECGEVHPRADSDDEEITCPKCEWEGESGDLVNELLQCDSCEQYRPILRADDTDESIHLTSGG